MKVNPIIAVWLKFPQCRYLVHKPGLKILLDLAAFSRKEHGAVNISRPQTMG